MSCFRSKINRNSLQKPVDSTLQTRNLYQLSSILILLCLFFGSCGIETPQTDLQLKLEDAKLVEILTEIHLVEAAYRMSEIRRDTLLKYSAEEIYQAIYEKHQITKTDFIETMEYYAFYPEKFKEIYEQVEQKIEKL